MGYSIMPLRGQYDCVTPCEHTDCRAIRELIESVCAICRIRIEGEEKYVGWGAAGLAHFICALERQEY